MYHASPVSDHGYAYMFHVEAILEFLQSNDAIVVEGYLGSKAKPCCSEKLRFHIPRSNRRCSYQQMKLPILITWALEANPGDPFPAVDKTALSTSRM